ncbi:RNA-binding cell elongation regulator Jag/EloR [Ilumatobacter sp.]|uniref:RNA-binding cell elongation regulator Jag/EloR n=1 Tax=Ilumatobacter sp. TaxID=1967498 RepID=UPI003B52A58A
MEWVETTAKTLEDAREAALDQLGVAADEAEFEVIEEPKPGLFGRTRGEARVRARVQPTQARPKQERRRRTKGAGSSTDAAAAGGGDEGATPTSAPTADATDATESSDATDADAPSDDAPAAARPSDTERPSGDRSEGRSSRRRSAGSRRTSTTSDDRQETPMDDRDEQTVSPDEVGAAAVTFMDGLVEAFGADGSSELAVDGIELDVRVTGAELGLLVGPGGRTLNAIQDLARVASQRRLGDHETRLRIDVAGYRERRTEALQRFAREVAESVRESGAARALEPMTSADRKVIHDALNEEDGVGSRSEGDDPNRRIVVVLD